MIIDTPHKNGITTFGTLLLFIIMIAWNTSFASTCPTQIVPPPKSEIHLVLNSNGFNAQRPSGFTHLGVTEHVGRGLTILHFNSDSNLEFKTFDTYGSETEAGTFIDFLTQLKGQKAVFALLAHDAAAKSLSKYSGELKALGFGKLTVLANRQAYVMHNFKGAIFEAIDDMGISLDLPIPNTISDSRVYFPRVRWEFEPAVDRYIAHAGGEVDGIKSTNTKDALDQNYKKGYRLFELDMIETKDGKLVAAHDWAMWARFTDYPGPLPVSLAEFKKHKIYGKYSTLDLDGINSWFAAHPDAILVTDKVNDPLAFAAKFVDKDRLIMELFSLMALEEAAKHTITGMISEEPLGKIPGDKLTYLKLNKIRHVAMSRRNISRQTEFLLRLKNAGIKVYVYNVNFDPGKDEKYVLEHEIGLVYGMYADTWVFDGTPTKKSAKMP